MNYCGFLNEPKENSPITIDNSLVNHIRSERLEQMIKAEVEIIY
jgi:hypothetical protein